MDYQYTFTSEMVLSLQAIEAAQTKVQMITLPPVTAEGLRLLARIRSSHFSTRIEGNRLTLQEVEQVLIEGRQFPDRERDTLEVQHYFQALVHIEQWVEQGLDITEERICRLQALIQRGRRSRPTPYRDGQNVIRDSAGGIVYLPPEAKEVPGLMSELVAWIRTAEKSQPIPAVAGIAHYAFVTIHPFYDGNGRTARALATWILYRGGYDLGRFCALDEFYAQDLQGYYDSLVTHLAHNYYEGRHTADIPSWLEYFVKGMVTIFEAVAHEVTDRAIQAHEDTEALLYKLDRRARIVLEIFSRQDKITANDVARVLGLSTRQARDLLSTWVSAGWLQMSDTSRKSRSYNLSAE